MFLIYIAKIGKRKGKLLLKWEEISGGKAHGKLFDIFQ